MNKQEAQMVNTATKSEAEFMDGKLARAVLKHLEETKQAFCFVDGVIVDRAECYRRISLTAYMPGTSPIVA